MNPNCTSISGALYHCTLEAGHDGDHIAKDRDGTSLAMWPPNDVGDMPVDAAIAAATGTTTATSAPASTPITSYGSLLGDDKAAAAVEDAEDAEDTVTTALPFDYAAIKIDPRVNVRASGVNTFGLYSEFDVMDSTGENAARTCRLLIVGDVVFYQHRTAEARGGTWRRRSKEDLTKVLNGTKPWLTRGDPIVVQLQSSDVEAIRRVQVPVVRYAAKTAFEKLYGKGA